MRHALAAYGAVLVILLMLARQFEAAGWTGVTGLDVATALVNAVLVLALGAGLLLAGQLGLDRWARSMEKWRHQRAVESGEAPDAEVIGVTSWRPGTRSSPSPPAQTVLAPPAAPIASSGFTYVGPSYGRDVPAAPPFPDRPGRRI
jgi:hypothetical protein